MTLLSYVLLAKILVSIVFVSGPLLFLPTAKLEALTGTKANDVSLYRLYGMAITALLVGYGFGLADTLEGRFPWSAVFFGVVSNIGATMVLIASGRWRQSRLLTGFFGTIGLLFILAALFPAHFM